MGDKYSGYEYIKRQDAFAAARKIGQKAYEKLDTSGAVAAMMITDELRAIPPVDVAPVRHGRWEEDCAGAAVCSVCNEYAFETSTHHLCGWFPPYCPNCGAKMGGE